MEDEYDKIIRVIKQDPFNTDMLEKVSKIRDRVRRALGEDWGDCHEDMMDACLETETGWLLTEFREQLNKWVDEYDFRAPREILMMLKLRHVFVPLKREDANEEILNKMRRMAAK